MRDILVTLIVFGSLPYIFKRPWIGAMMWVWISVMNPHSQGWGFAKTFPFAQVLALATVLAMLAHKEKYRMPVTPVTITFIGFAVWMAITSIFAIHPDQVLPQMIKVYKIFGMTIVVLMLLKTREHLNIMVWTIVGSIGFYGVKGGLFTIRSGGNERVWGPSGTFIDGNNEVALAFVMTIPLMYYLFMQMTKRWHKLAMMGAIFLCALAALGSYSRGAALAIGAMTVFLWLKSRNKVILGALMAAAIPVMLAFMPSKWFERIETINAYEEDTSATGRLNAWEMAFNLANDRFPVGGGFEIYDPYVFAMYAPNPNAVHAAHSVYFQVLGEHGWIGLLIYLTLVFFTWQTASWTASRAKRHPSLKWAQDMALMSQVSMVGFGVGGAFLSLTYFDVPYYIMCVLIVLKIVVERELKVLAPPAPPWYGKEEALPDPASPPSPLETRKDVREIQ